MTTTRPRRDDYRRCALACTHDLARGVLVSELLCCDGPFPDDLPALHSLGLVFRLDRADQHPLEQAA